MEVLNFFINFEKFQRVVKKNSWSFYWETLWSIKTFFSKNHISELLKILRIVKNHTDWKIFYYQSAYDSTNYLFTFLSQSIITRMINKNRQKFACRIFSYNCQQLNSRDHVFFPMWIACVENTISMIWAIVTRAQLDNNRNEKFNWNAYYMYTRAFFMQLNGDNVCILMAESRVKWAFVQRFFEIGFVQIMPWIIFFVEFVKRFFARNWMQRLKLTAVWNM